MKKNHKRISAAVLSLALGFTIAGAPMLAPVASAQPSTTISADQISSVNLGAQVSLTINKYVGEEDLGIDPSDTPPTGQGLEGAQFKIEKINLTSDLNTYAGWQEVAAIDIDNPTQSVTNLGNIPTGSNGSVTISTTSDSRFTVGVYRVTELGSNGYSIAKPFLVTLPFMGEDTSGNNAWLYSQSVAPKNQAITIKKGVEDVGASVGEEVNYTINASVPASDIDRFTIEDVLPEELTPPAVGDIVVKTSQGTLLTSPEHFDSPLSGQTIKIELNQTGRGVLASERATDSTLQVVVTFPATIASLPTGGIIRNDVSVYLPNGGYESTNPTDPQDPNDPDQPDDGATTRLGTLTINKWDVDEVVIEDNPAKFELWRCETRAGGLTVVGQGPLTAAKNDAAPYEPVKSFETGADGSVTLHGVQVINWVDSKPVVTGTADKLCVVETSAPDGFVLNPEPQEVSFVSADPDEFDMVVNVTNLKDTIPGQLPATGGYGTMALIGAGVLVAAAGGAAAVRGNRARNN